MGTNTPATQPIQGDDPIEHNPIQDSPPKDGVGKPARPRGPNAAPVVLGLVALVLAGLIIAKETMGLAVDWSRLGPGAIVAIGLLLVVLGAIGLVRRHDET